MAPMRLVVVGAGGRMGRELIRAVAEDGATALSGALERPGSDLAGIDAGALAGLPELGVKVSDDPATAFDGAEGILDFTTPVATAAFAARAAEHGLIHVIGTTGMTEEEEQPVREAAARARIVKSGNMSLGVNLLASLARRAAKSLGPDWDIEIVEMHHRHKVDAPSGTALLLGRAAAEGRGIDLDKASVRVRDGHTGPREEGTIGFATLRGGSVVGEHKVILAGPGERVELGHVAQDRSIFARGAVAAAKWAVDRGPGLYSMNDVLGIND